MLQINVSQNWHHSHFS